ncbi:carboxy terminal-processing peptidase [Coralloluteibacterium stylophorae]|uniref:Carboxy terminal-processing peptidase n=1 Tax=Coralloluteibacterium stylophorae TaxID=1776034 RepID=A0A8J7VT51_9GAMM|nr:carboxy terminal-processing peptidase [Coralloluteibacterium stylophorae]MBS7458239.1 carboxy terminal-processing peptidase [Coralloluteibacterium stylophorae]
MSPSLKRIAILALAITPALLAARTQDPAQLTPEGSQAGAARMVYGLLSDSRYAYAPKPLDAGLEDEVLKRYLDSLDSEKLFFLAADIDRFRSHKAQLGEAIKGAGLDPAYDVFNTYVRRVGERTAHARALLESGFDFGADEDWRYDREDAAWAQTPAELDELWRKSVKNDWLRLKLAGKDEDQIRETLDKRYANLEERVRELDSEDAFQVFMNAYAASVDPHTSYLNPKSAENFNQAMSLSLEGIGAVLQRHDDYVVVREIVPGGPASRSTLQPGDRISAVGQGARGELTDVVGWRIDDVVQLIRGKKGTDVHLQYLAAEDGMDAKSRDVVITRDRVRIEEQAAKSEVLEIDGRQVGVVELPTFYQDFEGRRRNAADYASATRDVARILREFKGQGIDAVVMDLRNNGGGSLTEAIELTGLFIDRGPVVQVQDAAKRTAVQGDTEAGVAWDGPLAVLVNRASASASEIFAAAIQDYGRGLIIGEQTFGKGTVQNLVDLDRFPKGGEAKFGQLKLTVAEFFRISGGSTQHKGVLPDIQFPVTLDATEYGESTYDNALPWTEIAPAPYRRVGNFAPLLPQLRARHDARAAKDLEFQWWTEDVAKVRAEREEKSISLNEAERLAERREDDARRERRQAERKAAGLEPDEAAVFDDDGLQAGERDVLKDIAREKAAEDRPDPLLRESAAILVDAVDLLTADGQLAAQVLPPGATGTAWAD